jgi:diguanylate cyclase (GGDEF)-like protein
LISRGKAAYTPARLPVLRWLTAGGAKMPPHIRDLLLSEIFTTPSAVILAVVNGLVFNTVAQYLAGGFVFFGFIVIDVGLAIYRIHVVRKGAALSLMGEPTPTDMYLVTGICWCALQGAMSFAAMRTCNPVLEVLGASSAMGLIGPISARYYPAPRYAMLLVCLCVVPMVTGAQMTGNRWMIVSVVMTPAFILGCVTIIRRLHRMSVALLVAEYVSEQRAQRDALTGLLNRAGLADVLHGLEAAGTRFVLFYLDLDGFKTVNDSMGHAAGDALLQGVAARLEAMMRESDTVARLGGDEFVIVTPNLGPAQSPALASAIIQRIAGQEYPVGAKGLARIGVSIGYACWPEDGETLDLLRDHADLALYRAKNAGKGVHRRFVAADMARAGEDLQVERRGLLRPVEALAAEQGDGLDAQSPVQGRGARGK